MPMSITKRVRYAARRAHLGEVKRSKPNLIEPWVRPLACPIGGSPGNHPSKKYARGHPQGVTPWRFSYRPFLAIYALPQTVK